MAYGMLWRRFGMGDCSRPEEGRGCAGGDGARHNGTLEPCQRRWKFTRGKEGYVTCRSNGLKAISTQVMAD